jgi:hypothetical protein
MNDLPSFSTTEWCKFSINEFITHLANEHSTTHNCSILFYGKNCSQNHKCCRCNLSTHISFIRHFCDRILKQLSHHIINLGSRYTAKCNSVSAFDVLWLLLDHSIQHGDNLLCANHYHEHCTHISGLQYCNIWRCTSSNSLYASFGLISVTERNIESKMVSFRKYVRVRQSRDMKGFLYNHCLDYYKNQDDMLVTTDEWSYLWQNGAEIKKRVRQKPWTSTFLVLPIQVLLISTFDLFRSHFFELRWKKYCKIASDQMSSQKKRKGLTWYESAEGIAFSATAERIACSSVELKAEPKCRLDCGFHATGECQPDAADGQAKRTRRSPDCRSTTTSDGNLTGGSIGAGRRWVIIGCEEGKGWNMGRKWGRGTGGCGGKTTDNRSKPLRR